MSYDTQEMPAFAARQVAHHFDLTAIVFEWNCAAWLSLTACLKGTGKLIHAFTPACVDAVIVGISSTLTEAQR